MSDDSAPPARHPDPRLALVMYADGSLTLRGQIWRAGLIGGVLLTLGFCVLDMGRLIEDGQPVIDGLAQRLFPPPQIIYLQVPPAVVPGPVPVVTVVYLVPTVVR